MVSFFFFLNVCACQSCNLHVYGILNNFLECCSVFVERVLVIFCPNFCHGIAFGFPLHCFSQDSCMWFSTQRQCPSFGLVFVVFFSYSCLGKAFYFHVIILLHFLWPLLSCSPKELSLDPSKLKYSRNAPLQVVYRFLGTSIKMSKCYLLCWPAVSPPFQNSSTVCENVKKHLFSWYVILQWFATWATFPQSWEIARGTTLRSR